MFHNIPPEKPHDRAPAPQQTPDHVIEAAFSCAQNLLASGTPPALVEKELIDTGFGAELSAAVVADLMAEQPQRRRRGTRRLASMADYQPDPHLAHFAQPPAQDRRAAGRANMLIGGAICLIGLVVTVATLATAQGGGSFVIAWGAIVFGAIQFFRGVAQASGQ